MNFQQGYRPPQPAKPAKKKKLSKGLLIGLIAAALCLVGIGGYAGLRVHRENTRLRALADALAPYREAYLPNIYVDGLSLGGLSAQEGIDAVLAQAQARQDAWSLQLTYQGHVFYTLRYSDFGVSTDAASVYALLEPLYTQGKLGTLEERKAQMDALAAQPVYAYTTQTEMSDERLNSILSQIQAQLTVAPQDAYLYYFDPDNADPFEIQPEVYGSTLDVQAVKEQIWAMAAAGQGGALEIRPTPVAPSVTAQDVRATVTLRSKATTPISSASTADRTSNIRTAFAYLTGTMVKPGERLSFNKTIKERTLQNGYKYAIEYISGQEELGVGGGVCQASTTLYIASLLSDLEIVSRTSHSDPVSYTTFGQDATVYWNRYDLVIRNNTSGTLYITARVVEKKKNSYECEVCIYGPKLEEGVSYTLRTDTVEVLPAPLTESYVKDTKQQYVTYKDEEPYQVRKARDGMVNATYLLKWQNGQLLEEKLVSKDTCKARNAIYYIGTLDRP